MISKPDCGKSAIAIGEAVRIAREVAQALACAHERA